MKTYWKYVKPYLPYFIIGPILMLTEVAGEVTLPKLMSLIINIGVPDNNLHYIVKTGILMMLVIFVMLIGGVGAHYFSAKASVSFAYDLRNDAFSKVQEFSFRNIDAFSTGSLVTRLTNDVTQLQNILRMMMIMLLRAPGMLIGALIMAALLNAKLAVVIGIVVIILSVIIVIMVIIANPRFQAMQEKIDKLNSAIQENLTNARVIKSFVRNDYEEKKFRVANTDLRDSGLHAFQVVIFAMPIMMAAMNITTLAVVWLGGVDVINGKMPIGDLTAFITYIVQILVSLMMLAMILLQFSRAAASSKRIKELLRAEIDLSDKDAARKDAIISEGKIEFKNVAFRYKEEEGENVLEDISFTIQPGELVGIIGSTGCGKTSLVQLIPRLYDATAGEVLIDGINVKDYQKKHLYENIGMVLQKNVLFSGTIMENLKWGDADASEEEIYRVTEMAQADNFVKAMPEGYETILGQGGVNLSGGQKQRLCIARTLLRKPKILILDDSTSAVDTATETRIRECFKNELADATKIIIAQRITSVEGADKIIVMDNGRITGMGTHAELLISSDEYKEIYYSQKDKEAAIS